MRRDRVGDSETNTSLRKSKLTLRNKKRRVFGTAETEKENR